MKKIKKNLDRKRIIVLYAFIFLSIIIQCGCGAYELNSNWVGEINVTVDGNYDEWLGHLYYFEDEKMSLGLMNAEAHFYICMVTEDRFVRPQMMGQGFAVWFDPEGGKKKVFGIRFPTGRIGREEEDFRSGMGRWR